MDTKTVNEIDYNIDLLEKKINWQNRALNFEIWLYKFSQDLSLNRGECEYRCSKSNKSLLLAAGISEDEANTMEEFQILPEFSGKVFFIPDQPGGLCLTENDVKRFVTLITEKHLGFITYQNNEGNWEFVNE